MSTQQCDAAWAAISHRRVVSTKEVCDDYFGGDLDDTFDFFSDVNFKSSGANVLFFNTGMKGVQVPWYLDDLPNIVEVTIGDNLRPAEREGASGRTMNTLQLVNEVLDIINVVAASCPNEPTQLPTAEEIMLCVSDRYTLYQGVLYNELPAHQPEVEEDEDNDLSVGCVD